MGNGHVEIVYRQTRSRNNDLPVCLVDKKDKGREANEREKREN